MTGPQDARRPASDHLLRTLAAVPPVARVLDLDGAASRQAAPLAALGFAVDTVEGPLAPAAEGAYDWVVATEALDAAPDLPAAFAAVRRALAPGGWFFCSVAAPAVGPDAVPRGLTAVAEAAGLALAEPPIEVDGRRFRGVYRRVEADTPV